MSVIFWYSDDMLSQISGKAVGLADC